MTPRGLINFLQGKICRLLVFSLLLIGVAVLVARRIEEDRLAGPDSGGIREEQEQVVRSIERPLSIFRPPPPEREISPPSAPQTRPTAAEAEGSPRAVIPSVSLSHEEPPVSTPARPDAPFGRLIPCETVITVDSSSIQTPIIGLVTEDIFHSGKLVIPAGTEVHGTARSERERERISGGGTWTLVWQTGEELRLQALPLDREFQSSTNHVGWGITDGSAGLRGRLIKSDDLAEVKLFAATALAGAANALTEKELTLLGSMDSRSLNNAPLKGAEEVLGVYAQRIFDSIEREGFFVRVPSGKQFYLYVLQPIALADRTPPVHP